MSLLLRSLAASSLAAILLATPGSAGTVLTDGYSLRVWQTDDGLPQDLVTSAVQTHDGFLWFGTENGLARFDGERFRVFNSVNTPELQDRRITRLFEDADGVLWIGHEDGAITRFQDGRVGAFASPRPIESEKIIGMGSDERGNLWAMHDNGAVESLTSRQRLPSLIEPAFPGIMAWTRNARGNIWLAENGQAARLAEGRLTPIGVGPPEADNYVTSVAAAADGGVWILCGGRLRKWQDGRWTEDRGEFPWRYGSLACSLELRDGTLAVGTIYSGLYLIFRDGRGPVHFDRTTGLPQNWVRFLYEDREGTLWAGVGSAGLVSIHATAFSVLNSPDDWQGCTLVSVAPGRDDSLWIGTDGAGLYRYAAGHWAHYGAAEGLENPYIQAVTETPAGEVWAGNYWWGGPYRLERGRFVRPERVEARLTPVFALQFDPPTGELLVGNRDGLLAINGERSRWLIKSPGGSSDDVCALVCDRDGAIWCGFARGGLARLAGGKLSIFQRKDGLASDAVQCLLADDGALWIGTADNGLSRLKAGRFTTLGTAQGLADNAVCHILDDGRGYFWLSTHHGIQRVAKTELNRCADGLVPAISSQIYDRSDGLPVTEFTGGRQAAGCMTREGRLWFPSSKGLVGIDPARIESNPTPPPVVIETLLVDGRSVAFDQERVRDRLPPDHRRLEFRFSGLSFVNPSKVLFKYRLDELDKAWVEAGPRRFAYYSHLPAGTYHFRVIACNNDGVWSAAGAALAFTVLPFFWQTWWFLGAGGLLALSAVVVLVRHLTRRRMKRRLEKLGRQYAIERDRARIAQDIHDDIGTSLTRIAMLSQPGRGELDRPQQAAATLARIYATAGETTRALDEIVWAVDPRHDTLDSLVGYMGKFAQELLEEANIRCRLDMPVDLPTWPLTAETRHSLFLAFKEALNNALKHASATEVHISLRLQPDGFELMIRDNGRGFARPRSGAGESSGRLAPGNGLENMERRLAHIGGRCEIATAAGQGTSVSFIVRVPGRNPPPPPPAAGGPATHPAS